MEFYTVEYHYPDHCCRRWTVEVLGIFITEKEATKFLADHPKWKSYVRAYDHQPFKIVEICGEPTLIYGHEHYNFFLRIRKTGFGPLELQKEENFLP